MVSLSQVTSIAANYKNAAAIGCGIYATACLGYSVSKLSANSLKECITSPFKATGTAVNLLVGVPLKTIHAGLHGALDGALFGGMVAVAKEAYIHMNPALLEFLNEPVIEEAALFLQENPVLTEIFNYAVYGGMIGAGVASVTTGLYGIYSACKDAPANPTPKTEPQSEEKKA